MPGRSWARTFSRVDGEGCPDQKARKARTSWRSAQARMADVGRRCQEAMRWSDVRESVSTKGGGGWKWRTKPRATSSHWVELLGARWPGACNYRQRPERLRRPLEPPGIRRSRWCRVEEVRTAGRGGQRPGKPALAPDAVNWTPAMREG